MAKGTQVLLAKRSEIEAMLNTAEERKSHLGALRQDQQQVGGVWEKFMSQFEALTETRIVDGAAIIALRGMVTPDDPSAVFYGETNLAMFTAEFDKAMADSKVNKVILNIYSPGGYVYGVEAAANRIYEARGTKPIVAYTDSLAASAAYWIASAADEIVLGSETAEVGSIGVYLAHFDYSEMLKQQGVKVTEITSGEFKGIGSPYSAMTAEEKQQLQADSSFVYTRFVNTVARNRGMEVKDVLKSANGLMFYGSEAIKAGLADSISQLQEVITMTTESKSTNPAPDAAHAAALVAAQSAAAEATAKAAKAEAELAAYRAEAAKAANEAATNECKEAVKVAFGREATAEEVSFYVSMNADGRKVYKANLAESKANRDALIARAGLTQEQVTGGKEGNEGAKEGLLQKAAEHLGYIVKAA